MASATLTVIHHDAESEPLRKAVGEIIQANKSSAQSASFLVYRPVAGTVPDGLDEQLSFVWHRHDDGDPNAPVLEEKLGSEGALSLLSEASSAVHSMEAKDLTVTRSRGTKGSNPPKYVLALAFKYDPSKQAQLQEAADAFDAAYKGAGGDAYYVVHKTGTPGERLVLIATDSPGKVDANIRGKLGDDRADELVTKLEDAVEVAWTLPLRYMPAVSNP